jgi:hypothetical protein
VSLKTSMFLSSPLQLAEHHTSSCGDLEACHEYTSESPETVCVHMNMIRD